MAAESYDNLTIESTVELAERLNIIRDMFTDDDIESLFLFMQEPRNKQKDRVPETLSEKCNVLINDFLSSKYATTISPLVGAKSICNQVFTENFFDNILCLKEELSEIFDKERTPKSILEGITERIRANERIYQDYLTANGMSQEEFENMINELSCQESLFAYITKYIKYRKKFINLLFEYSKNRIHYNSDDCANIPFIAVLNASKELHNYSPTIFKRAESLANNLDELKIIGSLFSQNDEDKKDVVLGALFSCVYIYAFAYRDDWKKNVFEHIFDLMNEPQKTGFVRFLNLSVDDGGSPYVEEFCDALNLYCIEKGIKPTIALGLIKRRKITFVRDASDNKEYVRVLNNKLKGVSKDSKEEDEVLHDNLKKLYHILIEKNYIADENSEDLFVYRLSGLNRPNNNVISKRIICNNVKGMAYVLRGLCSSSKEKFPSSTLNGFFLSKGGNIPNFSSGTNVQESDFCGKTANEKLLEAVSILSQCNFINVQDMHDGRR